MKEGGGQGSHSLSAEQYQIATIGDRHLDGIVPAVPEFTVGRVVNGKHEAELSVKINPVDGYLARIGHGDRGMSNP